MPDPDPGTPDPAEGVDLGFQLDDDAWLEQAREALTPDSWDTLGDYEILEEVSRGGQGVVLRARNASGEIVAMKRLLAGTLTGTRGRIRFEREMEIAARLDHPGIVPLLQREILDRQPLLVMPWVDGLPPDRWARPSDGPARSRREMVALLLRICDAVRHAHQRGVIHRDLKPSNILVDDRGLPHVLDFGIGKLLLEDAADAKDLTLTSEFLGSPTYAPPERLLGEATPADVRDDVYSLGILLYNLLADAEPYPFGETLASAIRVVQDQEPTPLRRQDPAIERDLEAVVHKAIAKESERRYASVEALQEDLKRFLAGEAVAAHPPSLSYRLGKTLRRNPAASLLGAFSLALVLGFGGYAWIQADRLEEQRNDAYQARGEARDEATRTHDALAFLTDEVLAQLDPNLRGRIASVPEILRDASADIGQRFGADPDLELEVRLAIGRLQLLNGDVYGAGLQVNLAASRMQEALEGDTALSASLRRDLHLLSAEVHLQHADFEAASQDLERATGLLAQGGSRAEAHQAERLRIRLALSTGQGAEAERLSRAHLADLLPEETQEHWDSELLLVRVLRGSGQAKASAALAGELVDRAPVDTIDQADALRAWGWSLFHAGALREAEAPMRDALALRRTLLGPAHPDVARSLVDVATWSQFFGLDPDLIRAQLEEAVAILRASGAGEQGLMASAWSGLASLATHAGDFDEAQRLYREAMDLLTLRFGAEHPVLAGLYLDLGLMEMQRAEHEAARVAFRTADGLMSEGGSGHSDNASLWMAMARNEEAAGEARTAITYFRRAADQLAVQVPEGCVPMVVCLKRIGALHGELGEAEASREVLAEAADWEARMAAIE